MGPRTVQRHGLQVAWIPVLDDRTITVEMRLIAMLERPVPTITIPCAFSCVQKRGSRRGCSPGAGCPQLSYNSGVVVEISTARLRPFHAHVLLRSSG
jgi:hypothetical protein